jgi:Cu/Ag efflux pump CusA
MLIKLYVKLKNERSRKGLPEGDLQNVHDRSELIKKAIESVKEL